MEGPDEIADRLSHVQQLQVVLCCRDDDLIWLLDEGVRTEVLQPSAYRTRMSRQVPPRGRSGDTVTELGRLGARSARGNPMASLAMRIWAAYESNGLIDDLKWHLRSHRGAISEGSFDELPSRLRFVDYCTRSGPV